MSSVHCFTSISYSYLSKARILCWSLKRFHPDWQFWVCITDKEPPGFTFDLESEPFDNVIWAHELPIDNVYGWIFKHEIVEICTAVKGPALKILTETNAEFIIYLDPDIAVFNDLSPLIQELEANNILLTPHQTIPEIDEHAIIDNEICSLKHGIYNLGFCAIKNNSEGKRFSRWWNDRLLRFCYDDIPGGLFVDQRWCDHVPAMFEKVKVLRDPGYNVASWNISHRKIDITSNGEILVSGSPLRFYHFTKIESVGYTMTQLYAKENIYIYELCSWYKCMLKKFSSKSIPNGWWFYGFYENGNKILSKQRILYRKRIDLQQAFPNPFKCDRNNFFHWYTSNFP